MISENRSIAQPQDARYRREREDVFSDGESGYDNYPRPNEINEVDHSDIQIQGQLPHFDRIDQVRNEILSREIDELKSPLFRMKRMAITTVFTLVGVMILMVGILIFLLVTIHWVNQQEEEIVAQSEELRNQRVHIEALKNHLSD